MKASPPSTFGWFALLGLLLFTQGVTAQYTCDQRCEPECIELVQNGGFESGFDGWDRASDADDNCQVLLNDGTQLPFPFVFTDAQTPIEGSFDAFTQSTNPGTCKLSQPINVPPGVTLALFSWKDRIFNHAEDFEDPIQEARVRVSMGNHAAPTDMAEIWSTDPGDTSIQQGPTFRSYDATDFLQGKTAVDLIFEQQDTLFFFNSYWDAVSMKVCTGIVLPPPDYAPSGGGLGDPHFKTWHGQWYDFHGICDMVLAHSEDFGNGLGLDIHLRTKARYQYSFIESAAIRIGDDILEVTSWGQYWLNGVGGTDLEFIADNFPVTYTRENNKTHRFVIKTSETGNESIVINIFKDMVSVTVENATTANFGSSVGLMGSFMDGSLVGRDGATIIEKEEGDHNVLGQDWQILESEPQLFLAPSDKPFGTCAPPTATARRRLGEAVSMEAAEKACARYEDKQKRDMCVFDVVAMGDLEVAEVHGAY